MHFINHYCFIHNKTSDQFSTYQLLQIAFKHSTFVHIQAIFNLFRNTHRQISYQQLNFRIFSFILYMKYLINLYYNEKLYTLSRFAKLSAISNLLGFFHTCPVCMHVAVSIFPLFILRVIFVLIFS